MTIKKIAYSLVYFVILLVVLNVFGGDYYSIPSESMENTLQPGDRIIISKLHYGPRIDLNSFLIFKSQNQTFGKRLPGLTKVNRGDVVVFNSPKNKNITLIKRTVAIPGDTVIIQNSTLFVNRKFTNYPVLFNFLLSCKSPIQMNKQFVKLHINGDQWEYDASEKNFYLNISDQTAEHLKKDKNTISIVKILQPDNKNHLQKGSLSKWWNQDYYGPIILPRQGVLIFLDISNIDYYKNLILQEHHKVDIANGSVIIDHKTSHYYKFTENYYFMMGDNRERSFDSRWIGLIPDKNIIGKAILVLWSRDPISNEIRSDRFFKTIY